MPILKTVTIQSYGAPASFHAVLAYTVSADTNTTAVTVMEYYDAAARADNRQPLGSERILLAGMPPAGEDSLAWIEAQLIVEAPEGAMPITPNRYLFAGGVITTA